VKLYTKGGDAGKTSLYSGERVPKSSIRVEAYGALDELQAVLGLARTCCHKKAVNETILKLEDLLVSVMGEVASQEGKGDVVSASMVENMETEIDLFSDPLPPALNFVLPGESQGSAALHIARTVARRAERLLWRLSEQETVGKPLMLWMNRLSDCLFALSRYEDWKE
jgi:cob(I)alamin adenosyltransferase